MSLNGTLLAIEGTDGSGKATQQQRLAERLKAKGYDVLAIDFPRYKSRSSYFVRQYLKGHYGNLDDVGPYVAALFYALDRYQAAPVIREALEQGKIVVTDRFTASNMAHQGSKLVHPEERKALFNWVQSLEYQLLGIPRPQKSIVLYVPAGIAQDLAVGQTVALHGAGKLDIHETDLNHLHRANEAYDEICQLMPDDFTKIDCARGNQMLGVEAIHDLIWQKVQPLLPTKPTKAVSRRYQTPDKLDADSAEHYAELMEQIFKNYDQLLVKLIEHLKSAGQSEEDARASAIDSLSLMLPVAVRPLTGPVAPSASLASLAAEHLPDNHSTVDEPVDLVKVSPRNELSIVADLVYQYSNLSLKTLEREVAKWPIELKYEALETALKSKSNTAFERIVYTWDIVSDYATFKEFQQLLPGRIVDSQALTPRYGYDIPELVEQAGLTDDYEASFDLSLQLYSRLQMTDHPGDAQYATLQGHRVRWRADYSLGDLAKLKAGHLSHVSEELYKSMRHKLVNTHPVITEKIL